MGLRQALMALMDWAIDVPQKLLQCEAKSDCCICDKLRYIGANYWLQSSCTAAPKKNAVAAFPKICKIIK